MIGAIPMNRPGWAAVMRQAGAFVDVILHIGAHRTGTTTFQSYLRDNADALKTSGIGFWGPRRTRRGLFAGILPRPAVANRRNREQRGIGRVRLSCAATENKGYTHLVISDENMIGSVGENLGKLSLYPGVGERMARYAQAFSDRPSRVFLTIRALDRFWASSLGYGLSRGCRLPTKDDVEKLATGRRSWRDVITDVACAMPASEITVLPFETYGGQPDAQLALMTGKNPPRNQTRDWLNATPHQPQLRQIVQARGEDCAALTGTGRWYPFDTAQVMALRETYLDDLFWLHAGADGLATFINGTGTDRMGRKPAVVHDARGQSNDDEEKEVG